MTEARRDSDGASADDYTISLNRVKREDQCEPTASPKEPNSVYAILMRNFTIRRLRIALSGMKWVKGVPPVTPRRSPCMEPVFCLCIRLNLRERLAKPLTMSHLSERFALLLPLTYCLCWVAEGQNGEHIQVVANVQQRLNPLQAVETNPI